MSIDERIDEALQTAKRRNPQTPEFEQALTEVLGSVRPLLEERPELTDPLVLDRLLEPERQVIFRVPWQDDAGRYHVNRGFRVEFNSALGPYKGGLRFHSSVNVGVLLFLAFEQTFKNALTGLWLGGGKGGSDFDPKGRSDAEIMRFCQSFMTELWRHIGPTTDVPAGDIGVGTREIGWMFGQYKRLSNRFDGTLTGKGPSWGGSEQRVPATGHGTVYFAQEMAADLGFALEGARCAISGSGNVALHAAEKLEELGAKPVTLSDSGGTVYDPDGIIGDRLAWARELKANPNRRIKAYAEEFGVEYFEGRTPWQLDCDAAFPCATQNELDEEAARALVKNGCRIVVEGANMPSTNAAIEVFAGSETRLGPAKAANAGGVATSQFEMQQNASFERWDAADVDAKLHQTMRDIYALCSHTAKRFGRAGDLVVGANIAGFERVGDAMIAQGLV